MELQREFCDKALKKYESRNFLENLTDKQLKDVEELFSRNENIVTSCLQVIDERNEVPFNKQFLYFHARTQTTLGATYDLFVTYLRKFSKLTTKQAAKIADGRVSRVLLLFEPKNRQDAMDVGFYGISCEKCGSFRTKPKVDPDTNDDKLFCYGCGTMQELKTIKLPGSK